MVSRDNKWQVHRVSAGFSFAIMQEGLRHSRPSLVKFAIVFPYQDSPRRYTYFQSDHYSPYLIALFEL